MKQKTSNYPITAFNFHSSQGGGLKKCTAIGAKMQLFWGVWYGYTAIKLWQCWNRSEFIQTAPFSLATEVNILSLIFL